jgi:hypothetical protein
MIRKIFASTALATVVAGTLFTGAGPASANAVGDTQGCTPGYWKNHTSVWQEFTSTETLSQMLHDQQGHWFTFPSALSGYGGLTMLQGLKLQGGPGVTGAAEILLRAGTAGMLNAAYDIVPDGSQGLFYPFRRFQDTTFNGVTYPALVPAIRNALNSLDRDTMINLATMIDDANNLGCPLS